MVRTKHLHINWDFGSHLDNIHKYMSCMCGYVLFK